MMFNIGDKEIKEFLVSDNRIKLFGEASGDLNPIHFDDDYAAKSIFKGRIAHGLLSGSFISAVLGTHFPGPGTVYLEQNLKFLAPVRPDDSVRVVIEIIDIDEKNRATLKTDCFIDSKCVIAGTARVILPV